MITVPKMPEPIKIVGLDVSGATPSGQGALKHIPLKLSPPAGHEWAAAFNQFWQQHLYMGKRRADANGSLLTVTCMEDELADGLLDELKKVVEQTNAAIQEAVEQAAADQAHQTAKDAGEKQKLADLAKKLNFD